jgi:hypothetical protein
MELFIRVRNNLRTLNQTRRDKLQGRLIADTIETLQMIEHIVLVKGALNEPAHDAPRGEVQ